MPVMKQDRLALDRASVRTIDQDGHLHVAESNISRAAVNGYLGREIPDFEALGLQPDKLYQLLRDPDELEKAAASFNGKPLLITHKPQTAADHDHELTVGAVSNVARKPPFLTGAPAVWDEAAIAGITSGEQKELSAAYRYKADMTPGSFEGLRYDGRMTDIIGNHVALVEAGRAGSQVVVGDAAIRPSLTQEFLPMAKTAALSRTALFASGALRTYLRPKLATDARIDLPRIMAGVTGKSFKADKPRLKLALDAAVKGKLAADASLSDVDDLLDELQLAINDVADEPEPEPEEEKKARMAKRAADKSARDAFPDKDADTEKTAKDGKDDKDKDKDMVTRPAMDAAIATAVTKASAITEAATIARMRAIQEAERAVRPFIGETVAQDSAAAVYKLALDANEVDLAGVPEAAYAALVKMLRKPDEVRAARTPLVAMDTAHAKKFAERFPNANWPSR